MTLHISSPLEHPMPINVTAEPDDESVAWSNLIGVDARFLSHLLEHHRDCTSCKYNELFGS